MRLSIPVLGSMLFLAGCGPTKEERWATLAAKCDAAKFTREQCALLFDMAEIARNDSDTAAAVGAVGVGLAAGAKR